MRTHHLDRLLCLFSALLPVVTSGCGVGRSDFDQQICDEDLVSPLTAIQPAAPVDYLELRTYSGGYGYGTTGTGTDTGIDADNRTIVSASGQLCAEASDVELCRAAFFDLPLESDIATGGGGFDITRFQSLAWSRGDEVGAAITTAEALEFLGEIDSHAEAALWAELNGHNAICGEDNVGELDGGYVLLTRSGSGCGAGDHVREHKVFVSTEGELEVLQSVVIERADANCAIGRLPAGACWRADARAPARTRPTCAVGQFFADVAELEAAAVTAFEQLTAELRHHEAPGSLRRAAARARVDEARHARVTARLARRYGARPSRRLSTRWTPRALAEVAADNAAEGCVRETFGALVASYQARRASDPRVRRALAQIARDETRHAALSWELRDWALARMSRSERRRVARAAREAVARLEHELVREHPREVQRVAGMPSQDEARRMFRGLQRHLA